MPTNKCSGQSTSTKKKNDPLEAKMATQSPSFISQSYSGDPLNSSMLAAFPKQELSEDMMELNEKIKSMMKQGENMPKNGPTKICRAQVCQVCGKEGYNHVIKDHIETNHLEGICIPCNLCEKILRTRALLRRHMRTHNV